MPDLPERMIVDADTLNFRTRPQIADETQITQLPAGHSIRPVERSSKGSQYDWIVAVAMVEEQPMTGYLAADYLASPEASDDADSATAIPPTRLVSEKARLERAGGRALSIPRERAPTRDSDAPDDAQADRLIEIVDWLDVEHSERYEPNSQGTYCNIYAHDYCHLAGTYLPRVWWYDDAIARFREGREVEQDYSDTIHEYSANMLYEWFQQWGQQFGWRRPDDLSTMQEAVNDGAVGVIIAQQRDRTRSGHVTVVVPEHADRRAERSGGEVTSPLQSQAGGTNREYRTGAWWEDPDYAGYGFWLHG